MIIDVPTARIRVTADERTFLTVLPTRWRRKPADIDTERNYVTVTLCIFASMIFSEFLDFTVTFTPFYAKSVK